MPLSKTPEQIRSELSSIKRHMARCAECGDLKRLHKLRVRLLCLQNDIENLENKTVEAVFRRSYTFDAYLERLLMGRKTKHMD